ncbi:MAG: HNH endonuclease [Bacteroidales bacterium]|nr:HNH endonuclease [Bacteroidales bacterium]
MSGTYNKTRNGGYKTLRAYSHRKYEIFYVHILVAKAFVRNPDPSKFTEVDHIDGNPRNNRASNLRWTDRSGNMMNPLSRKRLSDAQKGKEHPEFWRPVVRISVDGETLIYKKTRSVIQDGFSQSAVTTCCQGKIPSHKGYRWMYLEDYEKSISSSSSPE